MTIELDKLKLKALLGLHTDINETLRERGIVRSANNPTGDLAEHLYCSAFGWEQQPNSVKSYDAVNSTGLRIQIKARRIHARNASRQLSAMRQLTDRPFDVLAVVLFDERFNITRAGRIPLEIVIDKASFQSHTNSYRFIMLDKIWSMDGVHDDTSILIQTMNEL